MEITCPKCNSLMSYTDEMRGQLAECGACGNVIEIPHAKPQVAMHVTQISAPTNRRSSEATAQDYLRTVQATSNYAAFRATLRFVEICTLCFALLIALSIGAWAAYFVASKDSTNYSAQLAAMIGVTVVMVLAFGVVIRAAKQAIVFLADIADMLAEQGRRRF